MRHDYDQSPWLTYRRYEHGANEIADPKSRRTSVRLSAVCIGVPIEFSCLAAWQFLSKGLIVGGEVKPATKVVDNRYRGQCYRDNPFVECESSWEKRDMHKIRGKGFSLIELMIVIVILGTIGAVAIPRLTRGAMGAGKVALRANLVHLRKAIELYRAEHGLQLPTDHTTIADQLTKFTQIDGTDANAKIDVAGGRIYGPYLLKIPPLTVGTKKGASGFTASGEGGPTDGWHYDNTTGQIRPALNDFEEDHNNVPFHQY